MRTLGMVVVGLMPSLAFVLVSGVSLSGCCLLFNCGPVALGSNCVDGGCPSGMICDTSLPGSGVCTQPCDPTTPTSCNDAEFFQGYCLRVLADGGGLCTNTCDPAGKQVDYCAAGQPKCGCGTGLSCSADAGLALGQAGICL